MIRLSKELGHLMTHKAKSGPRESLDAIKKDNLVLREQIKGLQRRLNIDRLTKTFSKTGFYDYFEKTVQVGDALFFLDVDDFKSVNDYYGHNVGDQLLAEIANNLMQNTGVLGKVGRLAGDEFLILIPKNEVDDLSALANHLCSAAASARITVGELSISRTVSVGYTTVDDLIDPEHIVVNANSALREAKASGKKQAKRFGGSLTCENYKWPSIDELRLGLQRGEVGYFVQPMFDLASNGCMGYEALLRWSRSNGEVLGPRYFLDKMTAAYNFNTKPPLAAARMVAEWVTVQQKKKISFNISSAFMFQFMDEGPGWVGELLGSVSCDMVIFELVETIIDADNKLMAEATRKLRDLGICIALDDFGIGQSTLHRLQSVHVDYVKVDRHFLNAARMSDRGKCILQGIIDLIHNSGSVAIVEGIEDEYLLSIAQSCGGAFGQGFYLGRPGPISAWDVSDPDRPVLCK